MGLITPELAVAWTILLVGGVPDAAVELSSNRILPPYWTSEPEAVIKTLSATIGTVTW